MSAIVSSKLAAARFDYEYLGKDLADLERVYGFPQFTLQQAIETDKWERRLDPVELPDTRDIELFAAELDRITRAQLGVAAIFRQIENQAFYTQIEQELLRKMLKAVENLDENDDKIAIKLDSMVKALSALQERNPIVLADQLDKDKGGKAGVYVQIANHIN